MHKQADPDHSQDIEPQASSNPMNSGAFSLLLCLLALAAWSCGDSHEVHTWTAKQLEKVFKKCGDSIYTKSGPSFAEYKKFSFDIENIETSETERLNGVSFQGYVKFNFSSLRWTENVPPCWGEWSDPYGAVFPPSLFVLRQNGTTKLQSIIFLTIKKDFDADGHSSDFDCSEVEKIEQCRK
jgi:hypothetical protein